MMLNEKYKVLKQKLSEMGSVAVAFSGGVDSAFLLYAAKDALGDRAIAITAAAASFPERELEEAGEFCRTRKIRHIIETVDQFAIEGFTQNPKDRCYICKKALFSRFMTIAEHAGMNALAEGSNVDDIGDYRPGLRAIAELGIRSPLRECGFTKADIRALSHRYELPTWNKQSFACLASRIPYGDMITAEKLNMIANAEQLLLDKGFKQLRVRLHGKIARIELLPEDFPRFMSDEIRLEVDRKLKTYGFEYAALDLRGYRTGSMNEILSQDVKDISMR